MIASIEPTPLELWQRQFGSHRRPICPLAAMGYLTNGSVVGGLLEVDKLVLVVLYDEPDDFGRARRILAGFTGTRVPWGVRWGGPEGSTFFKHLRLSPRPGAKGVRLDTAGDLLHLALHLDREIQRHWHYGRRCKRDQLLLPRLWAGFRPTDTGAVTGDGPELTAYCQRTGISPDHALRTIRRDYFGLVLHPLGWVSHHWQRAVAIFADLDHFPKRQVFPVHRPSEELVGCCGATEYDFLHDRFRMAKAKAVTFAAV